MLEQVPICTPAIFILSGARPGEGCVIERLETRAIFHDTPCAASNQWLTPSLGPGDRGIESARRLKDMRALAANRDRRAPLAWMSYPVLNHLTRLAAETNAASGRLVLRGYEGNGPVTEILEIEA